MGFGISMDPKVYCTYLTFVVTAPDDHFCKNTNNWNQEVEMQNYYIGRIYEPNDKLTVLIWTLFKCRR